MIGWVIFATVSVFLVAFVLEKIIIQRLVEEVDFTTAFLSASIAIMLLVSAFGFVGPGTWFYNALIALPYFLVGGLFAALLRSALIQSRLNKELRELNGGDGLVFDEQTESEAVSARRNYLVRHFLGQHSLAVSYWLNGFLLANVATAAAVIAVNLHSETDSSLSSKAAANLALLLFGSLVAIWSWVGVWRSAGGHEGRGGNLFWVHLARIAIVLGVLGTLFQGRAYALQAQELGQLAWGTDPMGSPAKITIEENGKAILVDGNLTAGTADRLRPILAAAPDAERLILRSNGGRSYEGEQIAEDVARLNLNTEVKSYCLSACTLVLLAGRERSATTSAAVGFHQPSFSGWSRSQQQHATASLRDLYEKGGVAAPFLDKAMSVAPDDMWYPSHDELLDAKVLNTTDVIIRGTTEKERAAREAQLTRYLNYSARQIRDEGPRKMDELTTRTGADSNGSTLTIRFKLNASREQVDTAAAKPMVREMVERETCSDADSWRALKAGAVIVYRYDDSQGRKLFEIPVDECGPWRG